MRKAIVTEVPLKLVRTVVLPLALVLLCPILVGLLWIACTRYDGSIAALASELGAPRPWSFWPWPSWTAVKIVASFAAFEALLLRFLPGPRVFGPVTPRGARVTYRNNGLLAFLVSGIAFVTGSFVFHWFSPAVIYDHFGEIVMTCSIGAILFCGFLYYKGLHFPSTPDAGRVENPIFDYFWGTELHPRWGDFDIKQFANCRLGMMGWVFILVSFAAKQRELFGHVSDSMIVCVGLQLVYIAKFFWMEEWYYSTIDVMHDRFGFYICWGVTTWLPVVYTIQALFLVEHPIHLGASAFLIAVAGLTAIGIGYDADEQRRRVRRTEAQCTVWGRRPEVIVARFRAGDAERRSLLLISGWWGMARHFHYVPEMIAAIAWTLPCGFHAFLPWIYPTYLLILLVHRAFRDDKKCREKYGEYWQLYCERVPYRIVPGVF